MNRGKSKRKKIILWGIGILVIYSAIFGKKDTEQTLNEDSSKNINIETEEKSDVKSIERETEHLLEGTQSFRYPDGEIYEGDFRNGVREGKGTFTFANGEIYQGDWEKDDITGEGIYTYSDGSSLTGSFLNNRFVSGVFSYSDEVGEYKLYIEDEKETGQVEVTTAAGDVYSGFVEDGKLKGDCNVRYADGDAYSGGMDSGKKSGSGIYIWENGAHYEGEWLEDQMNGNGKYYYSQEEYPYLEGEFSNNTPINTCIYHKSAEVQYTTVWSEGVCTEITE